MRLFSRDTFPYMVSLITGVGIGAGTAFCASGSRVAREHPELFLVCPIIALSILLVTNISRRGIRSIPDTLKGLSGGFLLGACTTVFFAENASLRSDLQLRYKPR